ncbi:MAG: SDR family oxidoreductase [Deltaproteobacteria bacterium]|nr:SDR family oxidoreductase [Deltaproteobacteria bacterium]
MGRVLIAGCGDVGSTLAARLALQGHEVWGLRRSSAALPAGVRLLTADLGDKSSLAAFPTELDFVVYAAAADGRSDEAYKRAYVEGPANLLAALELQGQKPRRLFFTSSTAVYGQTGGEWVNEDSPTKPPSFSGQRLLEGEQQFLRGPFPATVVRLAGIYGPGRTWLVDQVRSGEARRWPGPPRYTNRIHRDDCAGLLDHLIAHSSPPAVVVGVDGEPAERGEVLSFIASRLGLPEPSRGEGLPPAVRSGNKRCSNARLMELGYRYAYPSYREGYGEMLALEGSVVGPS